MNGTQDISAEPKMSDSSLIVSFLDHHGALLLRIKGVPTVGDAPRTPSNMTQLDSFLTEKNVSLGEGGSITGGGDGYSVIKAGEPRPFTKELLKESLRRRCQIGGSCSDTLLMLAPDSAYASLLRVYMAAGSDYASNGGEIEEFHGVPEGTVYLIATTEIRSGEWRWKTPNAHFAIRDLVMPQ